MKRKTPPMVWILYTVLFIIALFCVWLIFRTKPVDAHIHIIKKGKFEEILSVDGTIRAHQKITVTSFTTGDLEPIDFSVGDPIKKNQKLATLKWDFKKDILSPIDGVISKVIRNFAGPINRGDPILEILDPNDLEIVVEVLTTDAVRLSEETMALVNGLGQGQKYKAQVRRISRAGFIKISALGIEEEKTNVYLRFITPIPSTVGDNFHAEVHFIVNREDNVITVPNSALFKNGDLWAVYKFENGKAHLQIITLSKKSETNAVVSEGLEVGDSVVVFPSDLISDGKTLKPISIE